MRHLNNPNVQTGTLLIEVPSDIGKAKEGYKRGGVIEAAEKFRKEIMSAIVWLFGIPLFNTLGNKLCEKILKVPMDIDYSNAQKGADSITNTLKYLKTQECGDWDVSNVKKYVGKFKIDDIDLAAKKIKGAKQGVSIAAWALNCILMGFVLPKLNQKITAKKLKETQENKTNAYKPKFDTLEEFKSKTKKDIPFTGLGSTIAQRADWMTYGINNDNKFRLISTDVPMIAGRCATARNKYEALEICFMDGAAIYFYNFCLPHAQKFLRKQFNTPDISSTVAEYITQIEPKILQEAIKKAENNEKLTVEELFGKAAKNEIYKEATFGKYGKIDKFVKNSELEEIDNSVVKLLRYIKDHAIKNGQNTYNQDELKKLIRNINIKNSAFYGVGIVLSILGLGMLIPKVAYAITKKISGKDGFIGIAQDKEKNC